MSCLAISKDGRYIISGSYDKTIKIWEIERGKEIQNISGNRTMITCLILSKDDAYIYVGN